MGRSGLRVWRVCRRLARCRAAVRSRVRTIAARGPRGWLCASRGRASAAAVRELLRASPEAGKLWKLSHGNSVEPREAGSRVGGAAGRGRTRARRAEKRWRGRGRASLAWRRPVNRTAPAYPAGPPGRGANFSVRPFKSRRPSREAASNISPTAAVERFPAATKTCVSNARHALKLTRRVGRHRPRRES